MSARRFLTFLCCLVPSLAFYACGGDAASTPTKESSELSECCTASMELVAQMPTCCREGVAVAGNLTGCCAKGLKDETPDAERDACCTEGKALVDQFADCCKQTLFTGKPGGCCEAMPAALLAQKP